MDILYNYHSNITDYINSVQYAPYRWLILKRLCLQGLSIKISCYIKILNRFSYDLLGFYKLRNVFSIRCIVILNQMLANFNLKLIVIAISFHWFISLNYTNKMNAFIFVLIVVQLNRKRMCS